MNKNFHMMKDYLSLSCLYQKGMVVYYEHDVCDRIGLLIKGQLKMVHYTFDGQERVLATLNEGDMFGDFLIFSTLPYFPGNLKTTTESQIMYITKNNLLLLLNKNNRFRDYFYAQLSEKALALNLHNKILMQHSIREKIRMWMSYQKQVNGRISLNSKVELANLLNVSRPSLSRELASMKRQGLIDYDRKYIYLKG